MGLTKAMLKELPAQVVPEALAAIDKAVGGKVPDDREQFASTVAMAMSGLADGAELQNMLSRYNMETPAGFNLTLDSYASLRARYPEVAFHDDFISRPNTEVTDTALFLVDSIVKKKKVTDRYDVMAEICAALENKFGCDDKLELNLEKLNLRSTKDILHAIDFYFVMCNLYPGTSFGRDRMRKVWAGVV